MSTEHDKLVEDCAQAIYDAENGIDGDTLAEVFGQSDYCEEANDAEQHCERVRQFCRVAARAALAIAVEKCAAICDQMHAREDDNCGEAAAEIRALLSPNDRGVHTAHTLAPSAGETVALTHAQMLAGYAVACKFGVLEAGAFQLTNEMFAAFAAAPTTGETT